MKNPSIKNNTIANYIGQMYMMLIGIVVMPLYLQYLGAEAYGLVGFFTLMQAWMSLLDLGLSPTLGRQAAYARGMKNEFEKFKRLVKSFEVIFFVLASFIIIIIFLSRNWVAQSWIKAEILDLSILSYCIMLMGIMIGLRWFSGLYRSGINGLEDQVWLNLTNIILTSIKFFGALFLLKFITQDIRHFFEYQLLVGLIELVVFLIRFYRILPETKNTPNIISFDINIVKSVAPFTLSIAYTAGIWVLITQTDKLVLSGVLTLADYGYFSLIALVAGSITILSGPISQAIMPRLTLLFSQGKKKEFVELYGQASQVVAVISLSVSLIVGIYSETLLYAWTGDTNAAMWGSDVLLWFALGNGLLAISAFQYYLQSAFGELKLHVLGSTISALIQVPLIYYAATNYGAKGAGIAWFAFRLVWFLFWTAIVHKRFLPGFHFKWFYKQILPIVLVSVITALILKILFILGFEQNRLLLFAKMICIGFFLLVVSAFSSQAIRAKVYQIVNNRSTTK